VIDYTVLPTVNATLNGLSGVFLFVGYVLIRGRHINAHRNAMLGAFASSTLFLISYVAYHAQAGSRPFTGIGVIRYVYFAILISHVILAAAILPMAITTLARGLGGRYVEHKRIAKWTFPTWMYVSVTGVIVYFMLYQM
jgi:putative membrane protein